MMRNLVGLCVCLLILMASTIAGEVDGFVPLFNGKDFSNWINVNCAPATWTIITVDGAPVIHCTGIPTGALRTDRQYENFIMEVDWRHLSSGGNSGIFIWATPIAAPGVPFLRGVEVQVLDHGYNAKGKNEWYTTHGDVFPIHGATMKPIGRHNGQRSFPSEERSKGSPEWNHYRIECNNGSIRLSVNGKEVSGGDECNYRKGYLGLEAEGAPVEFRNIRIKELPTTNAAAEMTAPLDEGFRPLYTGLDLRNWKADAAQKERWKPTDWSLDCAAGAGVYLASEKSYWDFELIFDWRVPAAKSAVQTPSVLLRGMSVPIPAPAPDPKAKSGKWARYKFTLKGDRVSMTVNGATMFDAAGFPGLPKRGPIGLESSSEATQWANIYVRPLNK